MKYLLFFLVVLAIFVLSVTLGAHNDQVVTFNYLIAQNEYCLSTLLATLFASGFILCWIICGIFYLRIRLCLARAERKIRILEEKQVIHTKKGSAIPSIKKSH
ncbi:LapA family protein [Candidatus Profftia sp. (ex Adelges kitamiensis)]|uniref:LapA family protein n=1 Tax=Candidatus Profftia sp. (ex Adelges kitamiensis) TaxID=2864218 RepID=UPI001CE29AEB|nr:LapA family protein [Candidatus Profftia sp. (ex Adelges kitamiensis)]